MTQILILAGGKGTRLKPLTDNIPKCLVKVNGKPIINHIIDNIENKPDTIYISNGYKSKALRSSNLGWNTFHIEQRKIEGTASAIMIAREYIKEDFIVLSGDIIYQPNEINKLLQINNSLLYTEMNERLYEYGTLEIRNLIEYEEDYISWIHEKSTNPVSNFVNCGAYHFDTNVFEYIEKTGYDERFNERIITNTINLMIKDGIEFKGIPIDYLNEISYPKDIEKVEKRLNG